MALYIENIQQIANTLLLLTKIWKIHHLVEKKAERETRGFHSYVHLPEGIYLQTIINHHKPSRLSDSQGSPATVGLSHPSGDDFPTRPRSTVLGARNGIATGERTWCFIGAQLLKPPQRGVKDMSQFREFIPVPTCFNH